MRFLSLVKQLAKFVHAKQIEKSSFSRSDAFVNELVEKVVCKVASGTVVISRWIV